ncbi:asparagine synthase (glutamine-hydrolyzing) [Intrasporangium sp. DVR]|uniref:asparagine synthase (glutamine-hydrolyzing) n=1 Tax=Intrasporangium sp. DVR TaxID=3127867 RepID=UPI00313A5F93
MCGLAGLLGPGSAHLADDVDRMSAAVAHRGPDDRGRWLDLQAGVVLAHRRLSIVDLSPAGHQPMVSSDGRWVVVLNGEIYDHADHRAELESQGVRLRGHSDTEVLLELIARQGPEAAIMAVDGMFALGLWDRQEQQLTLARDRLGEKPLYYGRVGSTFAFASELSAIRRLRAAPTEPDREAVAAFLRLGFVPAPYSILPGISKLPPGTIVRVGRDGVSTEPATYWSLGRVSAAGSANPLTLHDSELVDLAEDALRSSVHRRLQADVPVGAFLSGGLDSTTIVALAQQVSTQPVRSFTVAVGGAGDESEAASRVAAHLGTAHQTLPLPELDAVKLATRVAEMHDEPFADPSAMPTALLCAAAREHVTVALSGDGADELLGGYNRYQVAHGGLSRIFGLPAPLRAGISAGVRSIPPAGWDRLAALTGTRTPDLGTKAHKLAAALRAEDSLAAFGVLSTQWDPTRVMVAPPAPLARASTAAASMSPLAAMLLADQLTTLPDDMLVKVDRASMAVALEVRVPFLDHRFVELTWRLPDRAKVRDGRGKWLVRQILSRHVPQALWERPKVGFDPPLAAWLRGPLNEWAHDLLATDRLRRQGILRPDIVAVALAEHESGRRNHDYALWTLLMLQSWLDGGNA